VPGKGEALIRVHYSTVNPYDRIMHTVNKDEGFVLGCDGCGVVEATGEGVDQSWVGKKVVFLGGGWARYAVKEVDFLVPFADDFDLRHGANTYVNPFTVTAMAALAEEKGAKAVILMAASSALSKMMVRFCHQRGIEPLCVVRKAENVIDLKTNYGVKYAFDQTSPSFIADIEAAIKETTASVLFECVGGDLAGDIFLKMPAKSTMVVYGNLNKTRITIEPQEFHWSDKQVVGLMMYRWVCSLTLEDRSRWFKVVADDLASGGKIFGSAIVKTVPLAEWKAAIADSEHDASQGKYLI